MEHLEDEELTFEKLYDYCEPLLKAKTPEEVKAGLINLCPGISEEGLALLIEMGKRMEKQK